MLSIIENTAANRLMKQYFKSKEIFCIFMIKKS